MSLRTAIAVFAATAFALVLVSASRSVGITSARSSEQSKDASHSFDPEAAHASFLTARRYLSATGQQSDDKPVEQTRKNIQVLKGLPESQLFLVMNFVGDSLGVHCDYCHVKNGKNPQTGEDNWEWEKDDKKQKLVGRDMMKMMIELNRTKFNKEFAVTCFTCHRGSTSVDRMVPLPPRDFVKETASSANKTLPDAQAVISKYLSVVGARQAALSAAIVMTGTIERLRGGPRVPFEIVFKQPNKFLIKQTTPQDVITQGTNGVVGWTRTAKGVRTISGDRLKRSLASVALFRPIKLPDSVSQAKVTELSTVGDRKVYLLNIQENSSQSIQMFFDVETGLLLRSITVNETVLGPINVQWDFTDYKDIGGVKLPSVIRTADVAAFDTLIRRFSQIRIEPNIDENIFEVPPFPSP